MHLCFVDESGTPTKPGKESPRYFVIAGLIVPEERWHGMRKKLIGLKVQKHYHGELKWRFFAPNNNNDDNPMRQWDMEQKNEFRAAAFRLITEQKSVKVVCGVCDGPLAYTLGNVNEQENIYFRTYKTVTERFQYFLQDVSRASGRFTSGIIVSDHRNRGDDTRMREQHERLIREAGNFTSTYGNFVKSIFLSPSHMSIGIQLSDMVAGAVWRWFEHSDAKWLDHIRPSFRCSSAGVVDGWGLCASRKEAGRVRSWDRDAG